MKTYEEYKQDMLVVLKKYNEAWKNHIANIRDESELKLEYLIQIREEIQNIIENLEFTHAKWSSYEISKSKSGALIFCISNGNKYNISLSKVDEKMVDFDFYKPKYNEDGDYDGQTEVLTKKEAELLRMYVESFNLVEMCNASDKVWR